MEGGYIFGAPGLPKTPQELARLRAVAQALAVRNTSSRPKNIGDGLASIGSALAYRAMMDRVAKAETAGTASAADAMKSIFPSASPMGNLPAGPNMPPEAMSPVPLAETPSGMSGGVAAQQGDPYASAIAAIESRGQENPYAALGPVTKGDRAYGKYQVMGSNIPTWTEEALGQRMTPEQFMSSPEAQDAVFKHKFGQYAQKYGPEGAAKAWFAGEKGMNNPNAKDVLGTTVADYASRFMGNLGPPQAAPVQVASADPSIGLNPTAMLAPPMQAQPLQPPGAPAVPSGMQPFEPPPNLQMAQVQQPPLAGPQAARTSPTVQQLMQAAQNPWLSAGQQAIVKTLLQQELQKQDPARQLDMDLKRTQLDRLQNPPTPDTVRALQERAKLAGLQPGTEEYNKFMMTGGRGPLVQVGDGAPGLGKLKEDYGYVLDPKTGKPVIDEKTGLPRAAPIPGSAAAMKAEKEAKEAKTQQDVKVATQADKAGTMLDATSSIKEIMKGASTPVTGTESIPFSLYSGSAAGKVRSYVGALQSGVALNAITRLKEASATGATGFGAMNEKELQLLIDDVGALDPDKTDPEIFTKTVDRIEGRFKRVIEDIKRNVTPERIKELGLEPLISGAMGEKPSGQGQPSIDDLLKKYGGSQ